MPAVLRLVLSGLLASGCSEAKATPPPTAQPTPDSGSITQAEYGADWPSTVASGSLHCYDDPLNDRLNVTFSHPGEPGVEYAINGSARDFGYPELDKASRRSSSAGWSSVTDVG
jgi:hypothetical protein